VSPSLDIFFPANESQPVQGNYYAVAGSEPVMYGDENALRGLLQRAGLGLHEENIRLFIPGEWLSIHTTELPRGGRKQAEKLLPALLEEDVGENIDALHFALLAFEEEQAIVAVIAQQKMQQIAAWMQASDIRSRTLLPDWMALPCGTLHINAHRCQFRATPWHGWSCSLALAPVFLAAQLQHYQQPVEVFCDETLPPSLAPLLTGKDAITLHRQFVPRAGTFTASLLSGAWKLRADYRLQWQRWRKVMLAIGAGFLLLTVERGLSLWSVSSQVQQSQQRVVKKFQQLFPAQKRIVNLRAQVNTALRNSSQQPADEELITLLPLVASSLAAMQQTDMVGLQLDQQQQSLLLQLRVPAYNYFQALHNALAEHFHIKQTDVQDKESYVILGFTLGRKQNDEF